MFDIQGSYKVPFTFMHGHGELLGRQQPGPDQLGDLGELERRGGHHLHDPSMVMSCLLASQVINNSGSPSASLTQ